LGVLAVGIGNHQLVAAPLLDHVGNAGRKIAGDAQQFFVNVIRNAVPGGPQGGRGSDEGGAAQGGLFGDVVEAEAGFIVAATAGQAAPGHRVRALAAPVAEIDRIVFRHRRGARIHHFEHAAVFQVIAHHGGDRLGAGQVAAKIRNGHGNTVIAAAPGNFNGELGMGHGGREAEGEDNSVAQNGGHEVKPGRESQNYSFGV